MRTFLFCCDGERNSQNLLCGFLRAEFMELFLGGFFWSEKILLLTPKGKEDKINVNLLSKEIERYKRRETNHQ